MDRLEDSPLHGDAALILWGEVDSDKVNPDDLNDWWTNEHLPERLALPGFLRARRYCGSPPNAPFQKYLAFYEVATVADLTSYEYMAVLNEPTSRTAKFMPTLASMSRLACGVRYTKGRSALGQLAAGLTGATLAHVVFLPKSNIRLGEPDLNDTIVGMRMLEQHSSVLAFHVLGSDEMATRQATLSRSYEDVQFQESKHVEGADYKEEGRELVALVEFSTSILLPSASEIHRQVSEYLIKGLESSGRRVLSLDMFSLMCSLKS